MYISRGLSNSQWLWRAVTKIPRLRRKRITVLTSLCRNTASPQFKVRPRLSGDSTEKNTGKTKGDLLRRPSMVGRRSDRTFWMTHTPLATAGVPLTIAANRAQEKRGVQHLRRRIDVNPLNVGVCSRYQHT